MLKKRIIGVITVRNGLAVQSFGYQKYLPIGKPECLVENFDRWGADEILIQVIDRSPNLLGPDFELMEKLGKLGIQTPLIYSGGIRSVDDGVRLVQLGSDRIAIDALLHDNLPEVTSLSKILGAQAIIASMPISLVRGLPMWFDYRSKNLKKISIDVIGLIESDVISELVVTDWIHEGMTVGYDQGLVEIFELKKTAIIAFGGISTPKQMKSLLQNRKVSAIAVGNFLSYKEHALQVFKEALGGMPIRGPVYQSSISELVD